MIDLTFEQSFVSDFLNLVEIILIYRLLTKSFSLLTIVIDFFAVLIILFLSILIAGSLVYPILIVLYLWIFDKLKTNPNVITDEIFIMCTWIIMASLFDLIDHYTNTFFIQGKKDITILGWLVPFNDMLVTIIAGIIVVKLIRRRLIWSIVNSFHPVRLLEIISVFFLLYVCLATLAAKEGIANQYASLMLIMYFIIIIVGGTGFINFIRSAEQNQHQKQLINSYQNKILTAQKVNEQYENIRRERHDIKNMLLSIQGYIREHDDVKADQLLSTFLQNNINSKNYEGIDNSLSKLNIAGLRNLIKEKAYRIVEKGIPLAIEINAEIDRLPGSEIKTARIIGILLDNAIEATFSQQKPYIQFALIKHDEENYELTIANSLEKPLNLNKAMQFSYSEKENHQGIGLSNVTKIVDSDDHYSFSAETKERVIIMTCFIQGK